MKAKQIIDKYGKIFKELEELKQQALAELKAVLKTKENNEIFLVPYYDDLGYDTLCVTDKSPHGLETAEVFAIRMNDNGFVTIQTDYHDRLPIDELGTGECVGLLCSIFDYIQDENLL